MQHDCSVSGVSCFWALELEALLDEALFAGASLDVVVSRELRRVITRKRGSAARAPAWETGAATAGLTAPHIAMDSAELRVGAGIRHEGERASSVLTVNVFGATEESSPDEVEVRRKNTRTFAEMHANHARGKNHVFRGNHEGGARTAQRVVIFWGDVAMLKVHHQIVLRAHTGHIIHFWGL